MIAKRLNLSDAEIAAYYAARVSDLKQTTSGWWHGPCPIHVGTDYNFKVNPKTGAWRCHSQCSRGGSILELEMILGNVDRDTAHSNVLGLVGRKWRTAAQYIYRDEFGEPVFRVVRRERGYGAAREKKFPQERYEAGACALHHAL